MADKRAHQIAASMLNAGSPGLLHRDLYNMISEAAEMVEREGGELKSRQVIASIILLFQIGYPHECPVPPEN
jgi:hypothetical protein